MILYVALILFLISFLAALLYTKKINVNGIIEKERFVKGEEVFFKVVVLNKNFTGVRVKICFKELPKAIISDIEDSFLFVDGVSSKEKGFTLSCKYRGRFDFDIDKIEIYDFFGIFKFKRKINKNINFTVVPNIVTLNHLDIVESQINSNDFSKSLEEDVPLISEIRKYVYSDSLRKIHWKMSAKRSELISKDYQHFEKDKILVTLFNSKTYGNYIDKIIKEDALLEAFIAVMYYCVTQGFLVSIKFFENNEELITKESDNFNYLYELACNINFDNDLKINSAHFINSGDYSNIFAFTEKYTEDLLHAVSFDSDTKFQTTLCSFRQSADAENTSYKQLKKLGFKCLSLSYKKDSER